MAEGSFCRAAEAPRCMLATFGTDGVGRRFEAAFSCIASAHALNMQYIHMPLVVVQHMRGPSAANALFGLSDASCWPLAHVTATRSHCGTCMPVSVIPGAYKLSMIPFGDAGQ
ncbi:MAG: hypothetical protein SGPRY_010097, partial [Prymnesium sp.]